jgi:3-oxoacyl-[acyl-carrier-protein] synthase-1/3-oxoacyl-[acyl-carrier-protein] synthase II
MPNSRVAITGIGIVSPLGTDVPTTWRALLAGESGIGPIAQFDAQGFPTRIAAEVKQREPQHRCRGKHARFVLPFTQFAIDAAAEALDDAGIRPNAATAQRWGVVLGSGMMTCDFATLKQFQTVCAPQGDIDWQQLQQQATAFNPIVELGQTQSNSGLSLLIQEFGIQGYANSVHTACASGGQALGLAMQVIQRGEADYLLAGGFDSMINPLGVSSFCLLGALSTDNDQPAAASRPFDATRNGFVLGEGSAFLVLEAWDKAVARGAHIYAELAGFGNTLSAYRITDSHPNGDGATQAIERALRAAGVKPTDVDYINAHGTSTQMNDLSETNAIKAALGEHAYTIPVSSTKSQTGHLIAAAGALEAVLSVLAIEHGQVPMTKNRLTPDLACDLDYVTEGVREQSLGVVLSNSFGFGGSNSCLVFKHPELT